VIRPSVTNRFRSLDYPPILVAMGLWGMMWLMLGVSLNVGTSKLGILNPVLDGGRAILPYAAAGLGVLIILAKLWWRWPLGRFFLSPLGLAALYGLVGLAAALLSPDGSTAIYWTSAYLSVPLILWGIVLGTHVSERINLIINLNRLIIVLLVVGLFAVAVVELDLISAIRHPQTLLACQTASNKWFTLTSGALRDSGVGRYAAIAAITGLAGVWHQSWRLLWGSVLVGSLILLLFAQNRGAWVGFVGAASLMLVILLPKKALLVGVLALLVFVPLILLTGGHRTFTDNCLLKGYTSGTSLLRASLQDPKQAPVVPEVLKEQPPALALGSPEISEEVQLQTSQQNPNSTQLGVPAGSWVLVQLPTTTQDASAESGQLRFPAGAWVLQQVLSPEEIPPDAAGSLSVPPGTWVLKRITPATPMSTEESADIQTTTSDPSAAQPPASAPAATPVPAQALATPSPTTAPAQTSQAAPSTDTGRSHTSAGEPLQIHVPAGVWVLEKLSAENQVPSAADSASQATTGAVGGEPASTGDATDDSGPSQEQFAAEVPARLEVPPGLYGLKRDPAAVQPQESKLSSLPILGVLPDGFYTLSGRTVVWEAGWDQFTQSPFLGYGFHADRLILGTHMHNAYLQALLQTGLIGSIPFFGALLFGWFLLFKAIRQLGSVTAERNHNIVLTAGLMTFLTLRSVPESTGAFFGVDWLLLAPLLLYLHVINFHRTEGLRPA